MDVVVGMAWCVQHHRRREPMRRVPAVRGADGFQPAIGAAVAGQAVVLDIVGQQDLALGMGCEAGPGQRSGKACDTGGEDQRAKAPREVDGIGVHPEMAGALAQGAFGQEAKAKAALPGAGGKAVEAFAIAGRVGVVQAGDVAVMHKPVGAGVLTEKERGVDGGPEAEVFAPWPVDQLMRGGVADLAKPEARGEEGQDPLAGAKARRSRYAPGRKGEKGKGAKPDGDQKNVGGGKFGSVGLACGQGDQLVEDQGKKRHVEERSPKPGPAERKAEPDQGQGHQRGCDKGGQGQGGIGLRGHEVRYLIAPWARRGWRKAWAI